MRNPRASWRTMLAVLVPLAAAGCFETAAWLAMPFLYEPASLPASRVHAGLAYRSDAGADADKHRLDLYLPDPAESTTAPWPVLVFVHGGGWTSGDRALRIAGRDVYGNIGRFYAARGIATAVVSYRLQFEFSWRDQVDDVARAVGWLQRHVAHYGGDPTRLFLAGHSAGAYLVNRVALDRGLARRLGLADVCGLVSVSGAAYDLSDEQTYALGADPDYYEARFRDGTADTAWRTEASPVAFVTSAAPRSLVLYTEGDWDSLVQQARLLDRALARAGVAHDLRELRDEDHYSVVLALSREGAPASQAVLSFVRHATPTCGMPRA